MKVMVDLNVLLDVLQQCEPHYLDSAKVLSLALENKIEVCLPAHAITTIHYIISKISTEKANFAVDWLLKHFDVIAAEKPIFLQARTLPITDFEDVVVVSMAMVSNCEYVVTRNMNDFKQSPITALQPTNLLALLD